MENLVFFFGMFGLILITVFGSLLAVIAINILKELEEANWTLEEIYNLHKEEIALFSDDK